MARPKSWVEATKRAKEEKQVVSSQTRKPSFIPRTKPTIPIPVVDDLLDELSGA
jgi:hypothetical protein